MEEGRDSSDRIKGKKGRNYSLEGGRAMANVRPGEEIIISGKIKINGKQFFFILYLSSYIPFKKKSISLSLIGMSGAFPNSNNIHEFKENLYEKVNMVLPNRRWDINHPEIPTCSGSIPDIEHYDPGFFGKQIN